MSNRRMIMSADMLNVYQQNANKTSQGDEEVNARNKQNSDNLHESDDNAIYVLGYN